MGRVWLAALSAAVLLATGAEAQTTCSAIGGVTTCRDASGASAQSTTVGGVTTTRTSRGKTYHTTTTGGVSTTDGPDGFRAESRTVGGVTTTRSSRGRTYHTTTLGGVTTGRGSGGGERRCSAMGGVTTCNRTRAPRARGLGSPRRPKARSPRPRTSKTRLHAIKGPRAQRRVSMRVGHIGNSLGGHHRRK